MTAGQSNAGWRQRDVACNGRIARATIRPVFPILFGRPEMYVAFKCLIGALIMLAVHYLAQTKHYYAAGLVLMLPAISLPTYYFMHLERGPSAVQTTALFGMLSVCAYLAFLAGLYWAEKRFPIVQSTLIALAAWGIVAVVLLASWKWLKP